MFSWINSIHLMCKKRRSFVCEKVEWFNEEKSAIFSNPRRWKGKENERERGSEKNNLLLLREKMLFVFFPHRIVSKEREKESCTKGIFIASRETGAKVERNNNDIKIKKEVRFWECYNGEKNNDLMAFTLCDARRLTWTTERLENCVHQKWQIENLMKIKSRHVSLNMDNI